MVSVFLIFWHSERLYTNSINSTHMCESSVFLEEKDKVREVMKDVTRIIMDGHNAICVNIIGERMILENVELKEANLLSHGIVFKRM